VASAFALVVLLPQLTRDAAEGLEVFARGLLLMPFVVLLLVACWLVRREGALVGCAAGLLGIAPLTIRQGAAPAIVLLGIVVLGLAGLRAALRQRDANRPGAAGAGSTRVEP
jgi:hypothetical protein